MLKNLAFGYICPQFLLISIVISLSCFLFFPKPEPSLFGWLGWLFLRNRGRRFRRRRCFACFLALPRIVNVVPGYIQEDRFHRNLLDLRWPCDNIVEIGTPDRIIIHSLNQWLMVFCSVFFYRFFAKIINVYDGSVTLQFPFEELAEESSIFRANIYIQRTCGDRFGDIGRCFGTELGRIVDES